MNSDLHIGDVRLVLASKRHQRRGLLGFISLSLNGRIGLDGLTLRRTMDGRLSLSYPGRRNRSGTHFGYIHPLDDAARLEIEAMVLEALDLKDPFAA